MTATATPAGPAAPGAPGAPAGPATGRPGAGPPGAGRSGAAALLVLGSCTSLQAGAALALRLFPVTGAPGATLLRLALAAAVLLGMARPRVRAWRPAQWRTVGLYGISIAGTNGFFYAALARLPLGTAVTIQFLGPLTLAAALSRRGRDAAWVALAVAGVATLGLVGQHGGGHPLDPAGVACALVSAAFWALYIVAGSRASAAVPGRGGLAVAMTVSALAMAPFGASGAGHVAGRPHLLLLALGTALLASVVPYTLELAAMRRTPRRVFGVLLSLEPAVASLAGWILLGQRTPLIAIPAIAVVILASVGATLTARAPAAAPPAPASPTPRPPLRLTGDQDRHLRLARGHDRVRFAANVQPSGKRSFLTPCCGRAGARI
jgi:inner membrane transporter RhtA